MKLCLPVSLHGAEGMLIQLSLDSVECTGASSVRRMASSIYCRIRSLFRAKSIELICNAYIAQGRVEKAIRHFAFVVVTHGEQTKYHKPNERQEKWMYTFPCLEDFSLFTARRTGQSKREWFFAFFFFHLVLTKFVCCQKSLKCKQRLTHSPRVWAVVCRLQTLHGV